MFRKRMTSILLMLLAMSHITACQSDPARIGPTGPPMQEQTTQTVFASDVPAIQGFDEIQKTVFETLFDQAYDPAYFAYELEDAVNGVGNYAGHNQYGDPFELEVVFTGDIPLDQLGLTPADLATATSIGMEYGSILTWVRANGAEVAVSGAYYSGDIPGRGFQSRLMVTGIEDGSSETFSPTPPPAASAPDFLPQPAISQVNYVAPVDIDPDLAKCIADCWAEYNAAVAAANAAHATAVEKAQEKYQEKVDKAAGIRDRKIADAHSEYADDKQNADLVLAAVLTGCHTALIGGVAGCSVAGGILAFFTAGVALAVCLVAVHATYAACTALAINSHSNSISSAKGSRDGKIRDAKNEYNDKVTQAANQLALDIAAADAALAAALAAANARLQECLAACRGKEERKPVDAVEIR